MIFLDMDGVLCDFVSAAMRVHGREFVASEWPKGEWDIAKVLGISVGEFWRKINNTDGFWVMLDRYPWSSSLYLELWAMDKVVIATAPSRCPSSYSGKRIWLDKRSIDSHVMFGSSKHLMAAPGRILIDDGQHNIDAWKAAGGQAILFPQPWNNGPSVPPEDMVEYIKCKVACFLL